MHGFRRNVLSQQPTEHGTLRLVRIIVRITAPESIDFPQILTVDRIYQKPVDRFVRNFLVEQDRIGLVKDSVNFYGRSES